MSEKVSVSFVMPMFNERDNIKRAVEQIKDIAGAITDDYEIVIVDDASTDGSADIVSGMASSDRNIRLFRLDRNTKFGGAFAKGFKEASKDVILYMDSDMPISTDDIKESFPLIKDNDIVSGYSRIKKGDTIKRKIISGTYNLIVQMLFGLDIKDINSGYKIVKRKVVEGVELSSKSPFVDVELFIHAKRKGCNIIQYPLVFRARTGGKSYISALPVIFATFSDLLRIRARLWKIRTPKS